MFIFEKMVHEDRLESDDPAELSEATLPDGSTSALGPCAKDAFSVFEDLCLLANSEKPHSLKLDYLHKTFALELIESVLTNYHELFRKASCSVTLNEFLSDVFPSIRSSRCYCNTTFVR